MVNFVLNYLRREACESFDAILKFGGLPLHFYSLIPFAFPGAAEQGKAAFFRIVSA